ncbi:MAG: serine/threonine-protein kinase [Bryobacteraceae bacterium]
MMNLHWSRVREVFELALEAPSDQRADLIARECADDGELRRTVETLLHEHDHPGPLDEERPRLLQDMQQDLFGTQSLRLGERVAGRYRILRLLGMGGMGEVYEVMDERLDIRVALKTIRPDLTHDPKSLERFRSELLNARRITHPNVCRVFDIGTTQGRSGPTPIWFFTMELLDGETLAQRINRIGQFTTEATLSIARQVAGGLDAVHKEGVVHRDLKSANVFLSESNGEVCAKLTDFGLARSSELSDGARDNSTLVIGTPAYMAPEQLEGVRATPASDIYAFGLILFEMITGRRAFDAATPFAVAIRRLKEKPESPSRVVAGLPTVWDQVLLRCLDANPQSGLRSLARWWKRWKQATAALVRYACPAALFRWQRDWALRCSRLASFFGTVRNRVTSRKPKPPPGTQEVYWLAGR